MATVNIGTDIDLLPRFAALMQESLASESVYIRTKETLNEMFKQHNMTSVDKAGVITSVLGTLSSSITTSAMSTALQWCSQEKDLAMRKLELEHQIDLMDLDKDLKEAQMKDLFWKSIQIQAEIRRMLGTPTIVEDRVTQLSDSGKVWEDIQLTREGVINAGKDGLLLDSKLRESWAAIHRTIADTVSNYGSWSYAVSATGVSSAARASYTDTGVEPLADVQRVIAREQAKGYSYNAWANALTASAGMLGTYAAAEGSAASGGINALLTKFSNALDSLQSVTKPTTSSPSSSTW